VCFDCDCDLSQLISCVYLNNERVLQLYLLYYSCAIVVCCRKILEYMKAQNLMLNESIFNALIKGHVKNGFVSTCLSVVLCVSLTMP